MIDFLTQTEFDKLLATLDADREQAGAKYERLRVRLVRFFEWRNCERAEELTDTVFDLITKKIAAGEQIQNIDAYSATVAQFVFKENCRRANLFQPIEDNPAIENLIAKDISADANEADEARMNCLEKCLVEFPDENRRLIIAYHDAETRTMIATRKRLADSLEISLNVLRIRVCRLKAKLEECMLDCYRNAK